MYIRIRGVYATALTKFFLSKGFFIVDPSEEIRQRFGTEKYFDANEEPEVYIVDREDRQGVLIKGKEKDLEKVKNVMMDGFCDIVMRRLLDGEKQVIEVEFPFMTKSSLDAIRNMVVPTLKNHHRLKLIDSSYVDFIEKIGFSFHPEKRERLSEDIEKRFIWDAMKMGKIISIEHVKIDGTILYLSEGEVIEVDREQKRLVLKRTKYRGRGTYDGLLVEKAEGDYAITEIKVGDFFLRHRYFRREGASIGEYYNINTPVEIYPDKVRYVDLEVDVVRWPEGKVEILDEEILRDRLSKGYISHTLFGKAIATAKMIKGKLQEFKNDL